VPTGQEFVATACHWFAASIAHAFELRLWCSRHASLPICCQCVFEAEQWADIPGHPGYQVSSLGRIRSVERVIIGTRRGKPMRKHVPARILKAVPSNSTGHLAVNLCERRKQRTRKVHRLVLEAFVGPCPAGMEACHRNDVATDNRLSNLRWDTRSANKRDAVRNGVHPEARKTHCKRGHEFTSENTYVRQGGVRRCRECHLDAAWKSKRRRRRLAADTAA